MLMSVDTALNLLWGLVAVGSLAALVVAEMRRRRAATFRARLRRALAVFAACVSLFPCISASDDLVRFAQLQADLGTDSEIRSQLPEKTNESPAFYLARLLEALENFRVSAAGSPPVALRFIAVVRAGSNVSCDRALPSATGRAPPRLASLV